jgi:hypothetical protein
MDEGLSETLGPSVLKEVNAEMRKISESLEPRSSYKNQKQQLQKNNI